MADLKISALEIDGVEQFGPTEYRYDADDQDFDPSGSDLTETKSGPAIKEAATKGTAGAARGRINFGKAGNVSNNTFLEYFRGIPSSSTPYPAAEASELVNIALAGSDATDTYTVRIFIDGVSSGDYAKVTTSSKVEAITIGTPIVVTAGQGVSIEVISGSVKQPVVVLGERITTV